MKTTITTTITTEEKEWCKKYHRKYNELIRIGMRAVLKQDQTPQELEKLKEVVEMRGRVITQLQERLHRLEEAL